MNIEQPGPQLGDSLFGKERLRPVAAHAALAIGGVVAVILATAYESYALLGVRSSYERYKSGELTAAKVLDEIDYAESLMWPLVGLGAVAGALFVTWMWRARVNAEVISGAHTQGRDRGWVIGGWIVPVVSFWFPYQLMRDIWRASTPRPGPSDRLLLAWWLTFVGSYVTGFVVDRYVKLFDSNDVDLYVSAMTVDAVANLLLTAASGVLVILVVRRISAWQTPARGA